jgi:hypothetical protein
MGRGKYMSFFEDSLRLVDRGRKGDQIVIPYAWPKLSEHIFITPGMFHYIGGDAGSGKSGFADEAYILHPYLWTLANPEAEVKLKIFVWKMERPLPLVKLKWVSLRLWSKYRILTTPIFLAGIGSQKSRLPDEIYEKVREVMQELEPMDDVVVLKGSTNPTGIQKNVETLLSQEGEFYAVPSIVPGEKPEKHFRPRHEKSLFIVLVDHVGLFLSEKMRDSGRIMDKKQLVDKCSENMQIFRDRYGVFCVAVNQFNRNKNDALRRSKFGINPDPADFESSSRPFHDCDVSVGLIDPTNYGVNDYYGYDIGRLTTSDGKSRFRGAHLLKNSYGQDNLMFGMGFLGEVGQYYELTRSRDMTEQQYNNLRLLHQKAKWSPGSDALGLLAA